MNKFDVDSAPIFNQPVASLYGSLGSMHGFECDRLFKVQRQYWYLLGVRDLRCALHQVGRKASVFCGVYV